MCYEQPAIITKNIAQLFIEVNTMTTLQEIARYMPGWRFMPSDVELGRYRDALKHDDTGAVITGYQDFGKTGKIRFSHSYMTQDCTCTMSRPARSIAGDILKKVAPFAIAAQKERVERESIRKSKAELMDNCISALKRIGFESYYSATGENRLHCGFAELKGYTASPEDWKLSLNGLSTEEVFAAVLAVRKLRGDENSL